MFNSELPEAELDAWFMDGSEPDSDPTPLPAFRLDTNGPELYELNGNAPNDPEAEPGILCMPLPAMICRDSGPVEAADEPPLAPEVLGDTEADANGTDAASKDLESLIRTEESTLADTRPTVSATNAKRNVSGRILGVWQDVKDDEGQKTTN
jgi:hypothetical protein